MKFLVDHVNKCGNDKKYLIKSSIIAACIISMIFFISNMISGVPVKDAVVISVVLIGIFFVIWRILIKGLYKTFKNQDEFQGRKQPIKNSKSRRK